MDSSKSYLTVNYSVRPAKQVERRILIDAFLLLSEAGYLIRDYYYLGMGSIHFVDFALFHKFLGISKMHSVEESPSINKRVLFNAPYKNLMRIETGTRIGDALSTSINETEKYVVWLDYDNVLSEEMLRDVSLAASILPLNSIIIVTVDTEPPRIVTDRKNECEENLKKIQMHFRNIAENYVDCEKLDNFRYANLPRVNIDALCGAIYQGLAGKRKRKFIPLFNFLYADTHRMLTFGGMLGNDEDNKKIRRFRLSYGSETGKAVK